MLSARPTQPPPTSRRLVLTGSAVLGAAVLAVGCGVAESDNPPAAAPDDKTVPAVDTDSELVESVGGSLADTLALALATGTSVPQLRPLARRFAALHRAHLGELGQSADADGQKVAGTAETARARLLRAEEKLQAHLVRTALEAESGALAQVFASMAAALAQERVLA